MGVQASCCNHQDKASKVELEPVDQDVEPNEVCVEPEPQVDDPSQSTPDAKGEAAEYPAPELPQPQEDAQGKENCPPQAPSASKQEQGVGIDFDVGGSIKTVTTVRKPLGVIFKPGAPMTVGSLRPGSHAEELGVMPGWVMKAIGGEDVSDMNTEQTLAALQRHTAPLPNESKSVEIVFEGQDKSVIVSRSPFGAVFEQQKMPLKVIRVKAGSHAEKLCVKPGWVVKAIAGQDVSSMDFDAALDLFQRSFASLLEEK